jgi:hypothetical protein
MRRAAFMLLLAALTAAQQCGTGCFSQSDCGPIPDCNYCGPVGDSGTNFCQPGVTPYPLPPPPAPTPAPPPAPPHHRFGRVWYCSDSGCARCTEQRVPLDRCVTNGTAASARSLCSHGVFEVKAYRDSATCRGLHDSTQYPTGSCVKSMASGNFVKYEC